MQADRAGTSSGTFDLQIIHFANSRLWFLSELWRNLSNFTGKVLYSAVVT